MFRESLDADSAHAVMEIKASAGAEFQSRQQKGKKTSYNDTKGIKAPHFVRLVRRGNTFTGYRSTDGSKWVQHGSATIAGKREGTQLKRGTMSCVPFYLLTTTAKSSITQPAKQKKQATKKAPLQQSSSVPNAIGPVPVFACCNHRAFSFMRFRAAVTLSRILTTSSLTEYFAAAC